MGTRKRENMLKIAIVVLFSANCCVGVWLHCLPGESAFSKTILNLEVSDLGTGAYELQVKAGRHCAKQLKKHVWASHAAVATMIMNATFLLLFAIAIFPGHEVKSDDLGSTKDLL